MYYPSPGRSDTRIGSLAFPYECGLWQIIQLLLTQVFSPYSSDSDMIVLVHKALKTVPGAYSLPSGASSFSPPLSPHVTARERVQIPSPVFFQLLDCNSHSSTLRVHSLKLGAGLFVFLSEIGMPTQLSPDTCHLYTQKMTDGILPYAP